MSSSVQWIDVEDGGPPAPRSSDIGRRSRTEQVVKQQSIDWSGECVCEDEREARAASRSFNPKTMGGR